MRDKDGLKKNDGCKMVDTIIVVERRLKALEDRLVTIEKLLEVAIDAVNAEDVEKMVNNDLP